MEDEVEVDNEPWEPPIPVGDFEAFLKDHPLRSSCGETDKQAAGKHARMAKGQRDLAEFVIEHAKESANKPHNERHCAFAVDFAQNLDLPHLGNEQPDATCYFSPKNACAFGIADHSTTPETMTAHAHEEEAALKGADEACSMLFAFLRKQSAKPALAAACAHRDDR